MCKSFQTEKNECKSKTSWRQICMIILMLWQDRITQKFELERLFLIPARVTESLLWFGQVSPCVISSPTDENVKVQYQTYSAYFFSLQPGFEDGDEISTLTVVGYAYNLHYWYSLEIDSIFQKINHAM